MDHLLNGLAKQEDAKDLFKFLPFYSHLLTDKYVPLKGSRTSKLGLSWFKEKQRFKR